MSDFRASTLLPAAALIASVSLGAAGLAGWPLAAGAWTGRVALLASAWLPAGIIAAVWTVRGRRARRQFERHVAALCAPPPEGGAAAPAFAGLPPLSPGHPWQALAEQIGAAFRQYRARLQDLEHRRAALEIRCGRATAQYEKIRSIFANLPEPILAIDDYEEVVLANASAEALFPGAGETPETRALGHLVRCEKLLDLLTTTVRRKTPGDRSEEVELVDGAGNARWFRATATKLDGRAAGRCHAELSAGGVVAVLRDIGDHKALQKRNAEFVSAVSHEMKTPLAGIKAYVELLADGDAEDEHTREEFLDVINNQADRLQRLVENLLNIARIEAGVVHVNKAHQSLNDLLEEALHVVQPAAEAKQVDLAADLSPLYLGVLADRDMLLQAAINLLSNAVKYTSPGGKVTLRSRFDDQDARFEVQDTGVGLTAEDCRRIFDKFYRVNKDKQMAPGTGLGLPLAKHIVEDVHRGRLIVESQEGAGSTFAVILPGAGQMTTPSRGAKAGASS